MENFLLFEDDPLFEAWERCNSMVVSWIHGTSLPHIAHSVLYIDNAKAHWDELKERFIKGNFLYF